MRKQFTTTIEEDIQNKFRDKCNKKGDKMNDVLEAFMDAYLKDEFSIEKVVRFTLKSK